MASGTKSVKPETRREQRGPSLPVGRRLRFRLLVVLLTLTAVPGGVALVTSWLLSRQVVQYTVRTRAADEVQTAAMDIDERVMQSAQTLANIAADPMVAGTLLAVEVNGTAPLSLATPPYGSDLFGEALVALRGISADGTMTVVWGEPPVWEGRSGVLDAALSRMVAGVQGDVLMSVHRMEDGQLGALFLRGFDPDAWREGVAGMRRGGNRVSPSQAMPGVLVAEVNLGRLFALAGRRSMESSSRPVVLSGSAGVVYEAYEDEEYRRHVEERGEELVREDLDRFVEVSNRGAQLGLASAPLRFVPMYGWHDGVGGERWVLVQATNLSDELSVIDRTQWTFAIAGLLLVIGAIPLSYLLSGRMVGPIRELTLGVQRFADGDLGHRVDVKTGDELERLAAAVNHMAASLQTSYANLDRHMRSVDDKARQLELLYTISHSVNRVLELEPLLERIGREILRQIPCERLSVAVLDEEREAMVLDYVYPPGREVLPKGSEIPLEGSLLGKAVESREVMVLDLDGSSGSDEERELAEMGMERLCVVPLKGAEGLIGTLNLVAARRETIGSSDVELVGLVADSLAVAVEHSRLYTRVVHFAEELEAKVEERTKELRQAQAKLVQTEKFAATGAVAAHIAHEVNNPLSIIKNYLKIASGQIARVRADGGDVEQRVSESRASLVVIEEEIDRIARIVSQLRDASQPIQADTSTFHIGEEIDRLIDLFQGAANRRGITIHATLDDRVGDVTMVRDYLRQILINLVRNAIDALEEGGGGEIMIATQRLDDPRGLFKLQVCDDGCGIPEKHLASIFDPFFTTKTEGKGTGLGLSVSYRLAQALGGGLEAQSVVGEGTVMSLTLPVAGPSHGAGEDSDPLFPSGGEGRPDTVVRKKGGKIIIG